MEQSKFLRIFFKKFHNLAPSRLCSLDPHYSDPEPSEMPPDLSQAPESSSFMIPAPYFPLSVDSFFVPLPHPTLNLCLKTQLKHQIPPSFLHYHFNWKYFLAYLCSQSVL